MAITENRDLQRLRYWQGQELASRDQRDQAEFDARRRQLHNRALHSIDGVSFGLGVSVSPTDASRIRVSCGVGIDCRGRELLVQQPREIGMAAVPSWLVLRLRPPAHATPCCGPSDTGCVGENSIALDSDTELVWIPVASFERLDGVVLARVGDGALDPSFRPRQARPLARPRLARGQTVRGNTPWEPWSIDAPDGQGGLRRLVVGVQTYIDTSAAGFTEIPCYLAAVAAPGWNLEQAEFAPAFFPHVADPTVDGFTLRLLMVETTRRRYAAASGIARVAGTTRGIGDGLQVDVDDAGAFQKGDAIALLRPRARLVVRAKAGTGDSIALAAPLQNVEAGTTVLAIGNLPRTAKITKVGPQSDTMVAAFLAAPAVKKGDLLLRTSDNAIAVVDSVSTAKKQLTVNKPFSGWKATDPLQVARRGKAVTVQSATPDGATLDLKPANHAVDEDLAIVAIDNAGDPVGGPRTVVTRSGASIEIAPPLTAAEIAVAAKVVVFSADVTIQSVQLKSPGILVEVESTSPFAEGDFVATSADTTAIATVRKVTATKRELELDVPIPAAVGADLIAANWLGATTIAAISTSAANTVIVGRTSAAPIGSFVVRRLDDDSLSSPAIVKGAAGATLTLDTPIPGLARLDTLAIGAFPRIVHVLSQAGEQDRIQILAAEAGMLSVGDEVTTLDAGTAPASVAQVVAVNGNDIVLGSALGPLTMGQALGIVHFRDRALVTDVLSSTNLEVDRDLDIRDGDVAGVLTHYADNSNPAIVDRIETGNRLVLAPPSIQTGDGIVDDGWIDGGILGHASVAFVPTDPSPQWQFQLVARLLSTEGLENVRPAVMYGFDLASGRSIATSVYPWLIDASGHVVLWPTDATVRYRYRPETMSIVTTFNTDFPSAFATFAQKQELSVSWIGCQQEFARPTGCPDQQPYDPCGNPGSNEV